MTDKVVPFGKYKGRDVQEVLESDPDYLQWLTGQDWFRAKYVSLHQTIINRGAEPEETPEHNALQVLFLDDAFCVRFCSVLLRSNVDDLARRYLEQARQNNAELVTDRLSKHSGLDSRSRISEIESLRDMLAEPITTIAITFGREFETNGIDVVLSISAGSDNPSHQRFAEHAWKEADIYRGFYFNWRPFSRKWNIEIKPVVADDYPAVLRQMKRTSSTVLFLERYTGTGATRQQFIDTFKISDFQIVFREDCR